MTMDPVTNTLIAYAPLAAALYLIFMGAIVKTQNILSDALFRALPIILGVLTLLPYVKG
jgi:hypothetical protein